MTSSNDTNMDLIIFNHIMDINAVLKGPKKLIQYKQWQNCNSLNKNNNITEQSWDWSPPIHDYGLITKIGYYICNKATCIKKMWKELNMNLSISAILDQMFSKLG